ncbi:hypothetical protein ACWL9T_001506 [Acinetobacter baumannii]|uniref:hypothetical protein n=1 Tax=Acinetobacter baumannii TaxID=470 RepID=UPI00071339E1|nr:hypothetical protein [Acinetobacter baumannii]EJC7460346.1 hypothetical protein [Acinetobacter baumannii]EJG9768516.1 hypothetical protein [Acinetobacter baumannii]EJR7361308.1 hypothetical protein [Acinetobacter baumannii]EKT7940335.1 hypothetical protein [Acinetobacter baumannii]EKT8089774.1 hypothetical protein [Acinetobacter baumannii]
MKLLELAKKNLQEYISVRETLELIASTQQTPLSYVAIFLISQNFDTNISTYDVDRFFIVHSNDDFNWGTFQYTNSILSNLADNDKYKTIYVFDESDISENLKDTYWKRSELYNLNLIKDLSLDYYFRAEYIKNIVGNRSLSLDEFESNDNFSDDEVRKLLKSGIPSYLPNSVEKFSLIDDFVKSIANFFECDFDKGLIIQKDELKELLFNLQIVIKGFNDDFNEKEINDEISFTQNVWDENYLSQLELEICDELDVLENLDSSENDSFKGEKKDYPLYFKNCTFNVQEVACLISGYNPTDIEGKYTYVSWLNDNPKFSEALDFAWSAVRGDMFEEIYADYFVIGAEKLKEFLTIKEVFIEGFNAHLRPSDESQEKESESLIIDNLKKEIESLKLQLLDQDQKIKELELIQTTENQSKLGSTRAENNVAKLILALSELAHIDTSKPYAPYESLKTQGELLGLEKFPSDENVATWLKRANAQKS